MTVKLEEPTMFAMWCTVESSMNKNIVLKKHSVFKVHLPCISRHWTFYRVYIHIDRYNVYTISHYSSCVTTHSSLVCLFPHQSVERDYHWPDIIWPVDTDFSLLDWEQSSNWRYPARNSLVVRNKTMKKGWMMMYKQQHLYTLISALHTRYYETILLIWMVLFHWWMEKKRLQVSNCINTVCTYMVSVLGRKSIISVIRR